MQLGVIVGKIRPVVFGDYVLFHALAQGGMAEVYLARKKDSSISTDRLVVVKKIISESVTDMEFKELFKQEVSISMGLSHANIIQTYDYGLADGEYYLVMEYVPGRNLATVSRILKEKEDTLPFAFSCFVIQEVCNALSYTQSFRDPISGEYRSLVHRDISPQNILVGQIGCVKLLDFGIAKMQDHRGITRTGQIRGKASYLSPEQALQQELDARSDIFALGIVFWELLAGKRLFNGETDAECINMLLREPIPPPSTYNDKIPRDLDAIVMKALERDLYKRYQLAQEFHRDVHFFLQSRFPGYGPSDVQKLVQQHLSTELNKEEETIRQRYKLEPEEEKSGEMELPENAGGGEETHIALKFESGPPPIENQWKKNYRAPVESVRSSRSLNRIESYRVKESSGSSLPFGKLVGLFLIALLAYQFFYPKAPGHQKVMRWKEQAVTYIQAKRQKADSKVSPVATASRSPASEEEEKPIFSDPNKIPYELATNNIGYTIYVNGTYADVLSNTFLIPKNAPAAIRAELPGHEPIEWTHNPKDKPWRELAFVKSKDKGVLFFLTTPSAEIKILDESGNTVLEGETPIEGYSIPAGTYRALIENSLIGHKSEMKITVEKSKTTRVNRSLKDK